ncbi:DUF6007 family protein [Staphylococcus lutrae]|uniref:Uncharacterized protein n=1 Tax=Staphylococcus lutrae TaxID=155085 RepID=A0AAC9WJV8_9STAP|nr:DUF6007 family protein [Staphylococcus lutrae]ARJ51588.1 hypothetical protein B5P37_09825 [Staphylococcus lutrae]PNZ34618.1 hypothetical protein CD134_10525 [Staphylococcus lutrae]
MNNLEEALKSLGWLDLIFIIPMFLLFSYLPDDNFFYILINLIIVIFFGIGLSLSSHWLVSCFTKKK